MEFHIGQAPRLSYEQKRKLEKEKQKQAQKKNQKRRPSSFVKREQWRLLPCDIQSAFLIDQLPGVTFLQKMLSLKEYGRNFQEAKSELFPLYTASPTLLKSICELKKKVKPLLLENQKLRWRFKRFLSVWRLKRFHVINDTDFITLSPIATPIKIANFALRSIYLFEPASILNHMHKQLLHHDGSIPEPISPRNPYTNAPFSLCELVTLRNACKQFGLSSWTLEGFAKSKYDIDIFLQYQRKPLRMNAMKTILYNFSHYEGKELLLNFIESQHEEHQAVFRKQLYRWFLLHMPEEVKVCKWRSICLEYYEQDILAEDDIGRETAFLRIKPKTGTLCSPPHDLEAKRSLFLRCKKDESNSSVPL